MKLFYTLQLYYVRVVKLHIMSHKEALSIRPFWQTHHTSYSGPSKKIGKSQTNSQEKKVITI